MVCINNEEYITTRLDEQQKWFSQKSNKHQQMYKLYKQAAIAITIAAPIINYFISDQFCGRMFMLASGAVVTWLYFKNTLETHLELWLQYRATSEQLKREKYLFLTKTGTYFDKTDDVRLNILVCNTEAIIASDNLNWRNTIKESGKHDAHSTSS
ncbi:DUF4231 domain-containing protein [Anaerovibrio slackiae]|uniref:DUF4231 domain-containing protein n=1 Tax=Anaerovibrio slackiae TaxID=2652309 RepID=UPI002E267650